MLVFLCLDQKNGMAFHQRRQSLDRAIRADLLTAAAGRPVWMTPYSARQFTEPEAVLRTSDAPLQETEREGLCFVEFPPLSAALDRIDTLPYSARQFTEPEAVLRTSDAPLQETEREGLCFVEFPPLSAALDRIDTLVVYRWNRVYPTDQRLDLDLNTSFRLVSSTDIPGHSHEKITKEVYLR